MLLFVTTWMDLEAVMLSEIDLQRKTNTVCSPFYLESKNAESIEIESRTVVARGWVVGEMGNRSKAANSQL